MRAVNPAGMELIRKFEGCKLDAYLDIVGVPTIGYGHTGKDVHLGLKITQDKAEELLDDDVTAVAAGVGRLLSKSATANQFAALVSFAYNLGVGALSRSSLLSRFNSGDLEGAANEFRRWCHAGGKEVPGLVKRRAAERELFLTPDA